MKVIICLNGEKLNNYTFDENSYVIACDAGLNYLTERGLKADFVLGDFDSLGYVPENSQVFPTDKDYTDGELGLIKAHELKADLVEFICAGGKRDDQFFANVGLLERAKNLGLNAKIVTNAGQIYFVNDQISVDVKIGQIISLYPLETSIIDSSVGLKYQYKYTTLKRGETLGISNVATQNRVDIKVKSGAVLLFINN